MGTDHRANRLLAAMRSEDYERLRPDLDIVDLPRGKILHESGESIRHAYVPHDAVVSIVAVMVDGGTAEMAVFGCEGVFGLVSAAIFGESLGRYVVQVPGRASRIAIERLQEVLNASPALRDLFLPYLKALLSQVFQSVACNAVHSVDARCCRWILSTHDRMDSDTLPLTHEFLAEMPGCSAQL